MKKILISIFAVFALTVGIFLPTVANRNITAKADSSASINDDTVNYIEELLEKGESITDKWLRFSPTESLVTDNLTFKLAADGYISISKTENAASMTCDTIISKVQFGMVEMYIPSGSIAVNPLLGDVPLDTETKKLNSLIYELIKPETAIDNVTGTHLEWTEKELTPGDSIAGRWLRLFNQNQSMTSGQYGIKLSENYYLTNYNSVLKFGQNANYLSLDKFEKIGLWGFIDIYIPENAKAEFFNSAGDKVSLLLNTLTVTQVNPLYAVAIDPPVADIPETPGESAEPETPGDESSSESVIEPETPGESDVESIVESKDIVQSATDWVNTTLGLSLSTGALIVLIVVLFIIIKK